MRAFALMRDPKEIEETFQTSPFYVRNRQAIEALRSVLPAGSAAHYRGIGRFPFTEYPQRGPGWQGEDRHFDDAEARARELLLSFLGPDDHGTPYPRAFLEDRTDAAAVRAALTQREHYELVELSAGAQLPAQVLGFDVGYWGGGNFSILCDAVLWPTWHPATSEAIPELARHLRGLNRHALFPTVEAARAYATWYVGQNGAEGPAEDFVLIAVRAMTDDAG
jgi:hypothetical protein